MNEIIGNVNYRYIPNKSYIDDTEENIRKLADELTKRNISFSGRINDYKATVTVSEADREKALEIMNEIKSKNSVPEEEKIDDNDKLVSLEKEIAKLQAEMTSLVNNKEFEEAIKLNNRFSEILKEATKLKENIGKEEITAKDVQKLRDIEPKRKSVQNMLEPEVAATPKFEKLLGDELGEKSPYEMRASDNSWRNDNSKAVTVINIHKQNIPSNLPDIRKNKDILRGTFVNKDTNLEIIFGKAAIEEIVAKAIQDDKRNIPVEARMSAMYQMQSLIENSVLFDSHLSEYNRINSKGKSPNTLFMHQLYGIVKYENDMYLAKLSVEESYITDKENKFNGTTNRMYNLKDMKITPIKANGIFSPAVGINSDDKDTSISVTTITIPQLYNLVKTYDKNFFENPKAVGRSERLDEIERQEEFQNALTELEEAKVKQDVSPENVRSSGQNEAEKEEEKSEDIPSGLEDFFAIDANEMRERIKHDSDYIRQIERDVEQIEHAAEVANKQFEEASQQLTETNPYYPVIGDYVEIDNALYLVSDISSDNNLTLTEADNLFGGKRFMSVSDFLTSDFTVLQENEEAREEMSKAEKENNTPAPQKQDETEQVNITQNSEPKPESKNYVITDENFGEAHGEKSRFKANVEAIKTLKAIESENREATKDEQEILAKYTGFGAIPNAFDSRNENWSKEYAELKELLADDEYKAARASTQNAHYTSPVVINAIYEGLQTIGFESGKILEPAMGIGNFFGAMPENMRGSKLYGVELDSLTGRIAQKLYPEAKIQVKGFEETSFADNSFDVAVGNVPFGEYKVNDPKYNDRNLLIHDYFFEKTLDKVRAGGVVAFVTSKGTLDKENSSVREYLAKNADLLGAIRLPNNAFKANAGTEVTTDIIFLQKRDKPLEKVPENTEWIKKSKTSDGLSINNYFVLHPDMVMGKIVEGNKLYGTQTNETSCIAIEGENLKDKLSEAMKNIKGTYEKAIGKEKEVSEQDEVTIPENAENYGFFVDKDKLYYLENDNNAMPVKASKDRIQRVSGMLELCDITKKLLNLEVENSGDKNKFEIEKLREKLNEKYDDFVKKYGNTSDKKNANALKTDARYSIVSELEVKDDKGNVTGKADIFTKNTVKPEIIVTHVDTTSEALILSVSEKAKIDFDYMKELTGMSKAEIKNELLETGQIFRLPEKEEKYVTSDEYLSGNIRNKLKDLNNAPSDMDVTKNREALEAALPKKVEAKDISVKLGSHWVKPQYIRDFICETLKPDWRTRDSLNVEYSNAAGQWNISGVSANSKKGYTATNVYGTNRMNAYEIIKRILNYSDLTVKDNKLDENGHEVKDKNGKNIKVINEEETKLVRSAASKIKAEFQDWIFKDPERREDLVNTYNEIYNSIRPCEYDGSHLNFVGMNSEITLKEHQKNAIARALYGGNTMLAHAVGAGKTFEMAAIAMEGKRLGLHHKSLFAVPNSLTEQMGKDFKRLYPNANILVATQNDFKKENRQRLLGRIATGNYDAVIVGHSQFDRMALSKMREEKYLQDELDGLRAELLEAKSLNGDKSFSVKQIEKNVKNYEVRLEKLKDSQAKDDFIDFEQLGFDKIFVDESHMYKNLATATKMSNVSGISTNGSARASNLLMKTKYLDELTGGKGLCFASGTPVSNSMTEMYTLMRYLQSDTLKEAGINHFDEWASDFGEIRTDFELKPESDGKYQLKTRFAKFQNLPELMSMFKECADIRTADTLSLEKPTAHVHDIVAEPSKIQKRAIKSLGKRAEKIRKGGVDPCKDNMLVITNDGRKLGLDQRLLNSDLPDDKNSKVNMCVNNVFDIWEKSTDRKGTQCIFCDMSTPKQANRQDRFEIYRTNDETDKFECVRQKIGLGRKNTKTYIDTFDDVKKFIDKDEGKGEKLKDGDIVVFRVPSEDGKSIESKAALFMGGKFTEDKSGNFLENLGMSALENMPKKEFNIYDDIKDKLIAKGVPEKEIAFIHDYETAEDKQKLFNQMNSGEVRVLLGSTAKCGAGMNAQKKMVALHHLDCPMRPSDMEQRNGRIERQGNENKEVDIFRYVTNKTFDSYLYQMLENKQKFISQVMTSKTPERTCSDIDEASLDYAEVKALCAGNPLIKEEMDLTTAIKDLKTEKGRYNENIYDMQDKIRTKIPSELNNLKLYNLHQSTDLNTARNAPKTENEDGKEVYPIEINGKTLIDRKKANAELKEAVLRNMSKIAEGKNVDIGNYRGLKLSIIYDPLTQRAKGCLKGEKSHYFDINTESEGNLIRMDNCINNIEKDIKNTNEKIDNLNSELEKMKADADKPFPKQEELTRLESRLEEVHVALSTVQLTDDSAEKELYERLTECFPDIFSGKNIAERYTAGESFDPLDVEMQGNIFSMEHFYEQNGDRMSDPYVSFRIDKENEKVIPLEFENSGMGFRQSFSEISKTPEEAMRKNDLIEFTNNWLDNIEAQGYELAKSVDKKENVHMLKMQHSDAMER